MSIKCLRSFESNLILLAPMVCWFAFCLDIIVPALPKIVKDLHAPSAHVQQAMSLFLFVCGITQLGIRKCLIAFGRKNLILGSYFLILAGCLVGAHANSLFTLTIARVLQSIGSACTLMLGFISVRDITDDHKSRARICSYLNSAVASSPILIPLLGAYIIEKQHWHSTFYYLGLLIMLHSLLIWKYFPDSEQKLDATNQTKQHWSDLIMSTPCLLYYMGSGVLGGTTNFLFLSHSSYIYIESFGTSPVTYGHAFAIVGCAYLFACFSFQFISKKLYTFKTIVLGHALIFTSACLLLILNTLHQINITSFTILIALCHMGSGLMLTGSIVGLLNRPTLATNQVVGMYGCSKFIIPGILGSCSMFYGASILALSTTLIILSGLISLLILPIILNTGITSISSHHQG